MLHYLAIIAALSELKCADVRGYDYRLTGIRDVLALRHCQIKQRMFDNSTSAQEPNRDSEIQQLRADSATPFHR